LTIGAETKKTDTLDQWFPTRVPRHNRVPQGEAKGVTSYNISIKITPTLRARGGARYVNNPIRVPRDTKG